MELDQKVSLYIGTVWYGDMKYVGETIAKNPKKAKSNLIYGFKRMHRFYPPDNARRGIYLFARYEFDEQIALPWFW